MKVKSPKNSEASKDLPSWLDIVLGLLGIILICVGAGFMGEMLRDLGFNALKLILPIAAFFVGIYLTALRKR